MSAPRVSGDSRPCPVHHDLEEAGLEGVLERAEPPRDGERVAGHRGGDAVGHRLAPAALGFVTLFFGIGQAAGPWIAGAIADTSGSFSGAFLLAAFVAALGCIGSLLLRTFEEGSSVGGGNTGGRINTA